jgi:DNA-binding PadR family transcriptional regulator
MERDGIVKAEAVPWGERGTKRLYHVTDDGVAAFQSWMNETLEYSRVRDPVLLKAAYFGWADPRLARPRRRRLPAAARLRIRHRHTRRRPHR